MEGINQLFKVLFSPAEVFEKVKKSPKVFLPIIFLTLVVTGTTGYYAYQMNVPVVLEKEMGMSKFTRQLSDTQKDQIIERQSKSKYTRIARPIATALVTPIMLLLVGLYLFIAAKLMGSDAGYGQNLAVAVYGSAPVIIAMAVAFAIMLTGDASTTVFQNLIPSNVGYFFPMEEVGMKLYKLLKAIDFFNIWEFIIMIIGFSTITGAKTWKSAAVILVPWALLILISALVF